MTPEELVELAREHEVEFVDLRYMELPAACAHVTIPVAEFTAPRVAGGFACGGDRRLVPDAESAFLDPFCQHPTLALLCDSRDARTGRDDPRDPRAVARRAERYLTTSKIADAAHCAADVQFFVFDQAVYEQGLHTARYKVDSREGAWRRGRDEADNLGTQLRIGEGHGALMPADSLQNLRSEMVAALSACGVPVRAHRHGPATGGQATISLQPAPLLRLADRLMICKYVVRNVAARHGKVATFMPQPLFGERGSGLPIGLSLLKDGQPLLGTAGQSDQGRWALGGWRRHAASLLALTCPTTNSYRRLAAELGGTGGDAALFAPADADAAGWIGFTAADLSCNPYLACSALLLAALDGIVQRTEPGSLPACLPPVTLDAALAALESDHAYLQAGDVLTADWLGTWIAQKRRDEIAALRVRPHPYEFCLYFDV